MRKSCKARCLITTNLLVMVERTLATPAPRSVEQVEHLVEGTRAAGPAVRAAHDEPGWRGVEAVDRVEAPLAVARIRRPRALGHRRGCGHSGPPSSGKLRESIERRHHAPAFLLFLPFDIYALQRG